MKATISYEYNPAEPEDLRLITDMQQASKYRGVLWEIDQYLREQLKHGELSEEKDAAFEELRTKLWDYISEAGLDLND